MNTATFLRELRKLPKKGWEAKKYSVEFGYVLQDREFSATALLRH